MGRDDYQHERDWKRNSPTASNPTGNPTTPPPAPVPNLVGPMRTYLMGRSLSPDAAIGAGWYPAYYKGPRVVIPCVRTDGGQWWQARLIEDQNTQAAIHTMALEGQAVHWKRWQGSSGYRGDAVCFMPGVMERPTIVVEGPMDALAAASLGYQAIAILGVDPPKVVYDHVARIIANAYLKTKAFVIPDMDRVARWQQTQQELGTRGVNGSLCQIPGGFKDLAEMPPAARKEFLDGLC